MSEALALYEIKDKVAIVTINHPSGECPGFGHQGGHRRRIQGIGRAQKRDQGRDPQGRRREGLCRRGRHQGLFGIRPGDRQARHKPKPPLFRRGGEFRVAGDSGHPWILSGRRPGTGPLLRYTLRRRIGQAGLPRGEPLHIPGQRGHQAGPLSICPWARSRN